MKPVSIIEFGCLYCQSQANSIEENASHRIIDDKAFFALNSFISENTDTLIGNDKVFSIHRRKGIDFIRVKNYVGVIETANHVIIEVLPKVFLQNTENEIEDTRRIFLKMLRYLKDSPFTAIDNAHLNTKKFPIIEVFITTFLNELEYLIKSGLKQYYKTEESNQKFLKGKLDFKEHLNKNLIHKERFFTIFDEFTFNIPQNRIIKTTLLFLKNKSGYPINHSRIDNYLNILEEIPASINLTKEFNNINSLNRLFGSYDQILKWAKVFLLNESFVNYHGKALNKAILFPMEKIFEDYVAAGFRKFGEGNLSIQDKKHSLVDEHNGYGKFKLKPDLVIEINEYLIILDTKWKIIDENNLRENYEISQQDMYQLYAYGKKYQQNNTGNKKVMLYLLYPLQVHFKKELPVFNYERPKLESEQLNLYVYPFDVQASLETTIIKLSERIRMNIKDLDVI